MGAHFTLKGGAEEDIWATEIADGEKQLKGWKLQINSMVIRTWLMTCFRCGLSGWR